MEVSEENRSKGQWFVVQTLSGHENKVRDTLVRQLEISDSVPIYEVLIPMTESYEVRYGDRRKKTRKRFPGYLLIRMDLYDELGQINERVWHQVRSVQGMLGFLGGENHPEPLRPDEVASFITAPAPAKVEIGRQIHFEYNATAKQVARILKLDPVTVASWWPGAENRD